MAFIDDIKRNYLQSSMLMRIIYINIAVCLLLNLAAIIAVLFNDDGQALAALVKMPSDPHLLLRRPWTLVTYMFAHYNLLHILFNMLWLYWLGRIFMEYFSAKHLTGLYLLGGWGGAALYLLAYNTLPYFSGHYGFLLGASASVIAVVVATAVYSPDYKVGLLFLGEVSIKWIALVTVAIALFSLDSGNPGDSIAHIGGAIVGALFAWSIKHGKDITRPLNALIDGFVGLFNGRSFKRFRLPHRDKAKTAQPKAQQRAEEVSEKELDNILKKIKDAGYDALTDAERGKLFKASRRRNT